MTAERERHQLVVALGEGSDGAQKRKAFDQAAARAGKPVTVWARHVLSDAAGIAVDEAVDREEFEMLVRRVERLEKGYVP